MKLEPEEISDMTKIELLTETALQASRVMEALEKYGAGIVPHLMDTDENCGQKLRETLKCLDERFNISGRD